MTPHRIIAANAPLIKSWLAERGGVAVWSSVNLSNPGASWTTPVRASDGSLATKPTWQAGNAPSRIITDPAEIIVDEPQEVKRFRVAVRMGSQGTMLKVTDAGTRRIRAAVVKAGEDAWYEFDYSTQEAVIFRPGRSVPLAEYGT